MSATTADIAGGKAQAAAQARRIAAPVVGMVIFVIAEAMFFGALVSAYLVTSAQAEAWPPPDLPTLPLGISAFNAVVLLASGLFIAIAGQTEQRKEKIQHRKFFAAGLVLGACFILFQGGEWVRMLREGFFFDSGPYASFFYLILGAHGIHVCGALAYLGFIFARGPTRNNAGREVFRSGRVLWYFVVGLWPVLYALVYLYPGLT
tara:strand:+ start:922 stop:1536 length:615 start_codon:yes stop_codon:yes gene_type:complete